MAQIVWNSTLSVGVDEIDRQHKMFIAVINELNDAMRKGKGQDLLEAIVKKLDYYATSHFMTEENYFALFGYPEADSHKKEHASFIKKTSDIRRDLSERKPALSVDVMDFLSRWLRDHIMSTDKKYSTFFRENGVI